MRKALLPMVASLLLCGSATVALIATNARAAQSVRKPVMIAQLTPSEMQAQNAAPPAQAAAPDMMRRRPSPEMRRARRAQFCADLYARKVGELAFLEAKLELTSAQQPLFDSWKQASLNVAKQHENECTTAAGQQQAGPPHRPSLVDFMNRQETRLKNRLADIDAVRPSLEAFYHSLAPAQQLQLDRSRMRMADRKGGGAFRRHMMLGMAGRVRPPEMGGMPMPHGPGAMPPPQPPVQ